VSEPDPGAGSLRPVWIERSQIMKRIAGSIGIALLIIFAAASTGCTKSDAVAAKEMAARLQDLENADVEFVARELD